MKPEEFDPIQLEVFKHLFAAIPEEMGAVLRKSSYSPNIKERRDFSCALFDAQGRMIAQASHIPVHLGAMPLSVAQAIEEMDFYPGDMVILNDPFRGGTHLPDITMIAPIFESKGNTPSLLGFAANRAHHADVGGMLPGSMPIATEIYQEGLILPPVKIIDAGRVNNALWETILANVRTPRRLTCTTCFQSPWCRTDA
jgi:N-methylhydantoinase B